MSYFLQSGDSFMPAPSRDALLDALPTGNYSVEESMSGLFFKRGEPFQSIGRLYGDLDRWAERILNTFEDRPGNTGALLEGEKGSGKSLLGRLISSKAAERNMPTILVSNPWPGDRLGPLLAHLSSPAVVFLDEFEKVYGNPQLQETVLSLLDGTQSTRHLFVLTVNDSYRVDQHMKNRPGRLFYSLSFKGLEPEFIREYCGDQLKNKAHIEAVIRLTALFDSFNFDMLKALVEEMNRYDETPTEAVKMLNITPAESLAYYSIEVRDPAGVKRPMEDDQWWGNPLFLDEWELILEESDEDQGDTEPAAVSMNKTADDSMKQWERELLGVPTGPDGEAMTLSAEDMVSFSVETSTYVFKKEDWTVTFTGRGKAKTRGHWSEAAF